MCQPHYTISPAFVRSTSRKALQVALPCKSYGKRVTAKLLLEVILMVAYTGSSLSAIVKRFAFGFSHETARKALDANLPDLEPLTLGLLDALYQFTSPRTLCRRRWVVAIDEHRSPFYGDRSTEGVTGGQKKHGTKYAYGYATAVLVHHRHRYTVGLIALTQSRQPHHIVAALLAQMEARGLKLRGLVLDSGYDSGETLLLLQARNLSYTVPLRRKGSNNSRRNAIWDLQVGTVTTVHWKTEERNKAVSTHAVVLRRPGEKNKRVYAFGGWDERQTRSEVERARLAKRWYRKRFGIETSYRQMRECQAKTTKKDVRYRLLLVGVALLMRQVWVWLTWQLTRDRRLRPTQWAGELSLKRMREWVVDLLKRKYKEEKAIRLESPLLPLDLP